MILQKQSGAVVACYNWIRSIVTSASIIGSVFSQTDSMWQREEKLMIHMQSSCVYVIHPDMGLKINSWSDLNFMQTYVYLYLRCV